MNESNLRDGAPGSDGVNHSRPHGQRRNVEPLGVQYLTQEEAALRAALSLPGIKSDRWIRHMAATQNMIEPFEPDLVKTAADGKRVISYGTSSYGYDLRCANEFKIFTNVRGGIVDPKNFDDSVFVSHTGDYCDIPPNGFVLARTMEYMRIPRNTMTICLGKSTYARCFTGDTKVLCADNVGRTFLELVDAWKGGITYPIYCMNEAGEIVVSYYENPRLVGQEKVVEVVTNIGLQSDTNRASFRSTPDHEHFVSVSKTVRSDQLKPGDSLMIPWVYKVSKPIGTNPAAIEYRADPMEMVESVVECEGLHDVFCLTAPVHGNFILADSGVITKNCGIIVNVTPFEPEWEGYVTLEFSNTTPLPARIYAGEGCAQVLFFTSPDECATSYADRGGKYQGQTGVVPPRM